MGHLILKYEHTLESNLVCVDQAQAPHHGAENARGKAREHRLHITISLLGAFCDGLEEHISAIYHFSTSAWTPPNTHSSGAPCENVPIVIQQYRNVTGLFLKRHPKIFFPLRTPRTTS